MSLLMGQNYCKILWWKGEKESEENRSREKLFFSYGGWVGNSLNRSRKS